MTTLVPPDRIESLVGARRHRAAHIGRAVSAEQTVYILHSRACKNSGIDLRECRFSLALDSGIVAEQWRGQEDRPVFLGVWNGRLVPIRTARETPEMCSACLARGAGDMAPDPRS